MDVDDFPSVELPPTHSTRELGNDDAPDSHDQLPSVEAYKAQQGTEAIVAREEKRHKKVVLATLLTFVMLVIVFCTAVSTGNKKRKSSSDKSHSSDESTTSSRKPRVDKVIKFISKDMAWSEPAAFTSKGTAQYRAAQWIADVDVRTVPISNTEEFRSRYVLAVFYYATKGEYWSHDIGWLTSLSHCEWDALYPGQSGKQVRVGVECKGTQTVTRLFLPSMALKGPLPHEVVHLRDLSHIDFSHNDLTGKLPDEWSALSRMESIILHHNHFTGTLPSWLHKWSRLDTIDVAHNRMHGPLPNYFGNFTDLSSINLEHNDFSESLEPLKEAKKLTYLAVGDNRFTGKVSNDYLAAWYALTVFDVSDNKLTGHLPHGIFQMRNAQVLDLHGNNFTGPLSFSEDVNIALEFLAVHDNQLDGPINENIANLVNLKHLDMSNNKLVGDIPGHAFATMSKLKYLFLAFNKNFNPQEIPVAIASMNNLEDLSLQATNRIGKIPREFHLLSKLVMFDVIDNSLTGSIPSEWATLEALKFLLLKKNELTGTIPTEFQSLKNLDTFLVEQNNITGGAGQICESKLKMRKFVSDCSETGCTCCSLCCDDAKPKCNDLIWFGQQDPSSNYLYKRVNYRFNEEDVIMPLPEHDHMTDFYDTFGMLTEQKNPFLPGDEENPFDDPQP